MIDELISQLSSTEYRIRAKAFEHARKFVIRSGDNQGVESLIKKSFGAKGTQDIRVDIEIIKGKAFIADSPDTQSN